MLVLSRKIGEVICIGDDIKIQIIEIRRGQIKIGIEAPRDCRIIRFELIEKEQPQKEEKGTNAKGRKADSEESR